MATGTVDPALLLTGPGILYHAPLGSAEPANTVTAGKFSAAAWGTPWVVMGATDTGSEFSDSAETDDLTVAEVGYAVKVITTGRTATWTAALAHINRTNLMLALNGGTATILSAVAGSEATRIAPPTIGAEVRKMIGWQSEDDTVRFFGYSAFQTGSLGVGFRRGTDKSTLSCEWRLEKPTTGEPWNIIVAGAGRVA